jgi:hypothetical protein
MGGGELKGERGMATNIGVCTLQYSKFYRSPFE